MFFNRRRNSASETSAFGGFWLSDARGTISYLFFIATLHVDYHASALVYQERTRQESSASSAEAVKGELHRPELSELI
jgi:hypothetical protein